MQIGGWLRFAAAAAPVAAVFVIMEVLLWRGAGSFTAPVNLVGALTIPLLGGVFPMLIIAAARRRGERVPGTSLRGLGSWAVVAAVIALYLGGVIAHALFIWTDPLERIVAGLTAVGIVLLIIVSLRRGSFVPRTVVELRADEPPGAGMDIAVVTDGRRFAPGTARLANLAAVGEVSARLPTDRPAEVDIWAHRPTRDGDTEDLPVEAEVGVAQVTVKPVDGWLPN